MRKPNYFFVVAEQVLFVIVYVLLFKGYPERFVSVNVFSIILPMSFGILLSRFVFYLSEKYKQDHGWIIVNIIRVILSGIILSLSIFAISYFGNEPISLQTIIILVLGAVIYLYITGFCAWEYQKLLELNETDCENFKELEE